jgi:hypothetical protein
VDRPIARQVKPETIEPGCLDFQLDHLKGYIRFKGGDTIRFGHPLNKRELNRISVAHRRVDWKRPFIKVKVLNGQDRLVLPKCYIMDYKIKGGVLTIMRVRAWADYSYEWPDDGTGCMQIIRQVIE